MADSIDRVFVYALNTVKRIPRLGSARPPPAERLKLYGLYKQSMEGDVDGVMDRPQSPDLPSMANHVNGNRKLADNNDHDNARAGQNHINGTDRERRGSRSADEVKADQQKWDAWYAQRGLSRTEAKRRYIATLIETMRVYASQTVDARELVAELEFVWDQIKSNPATSSDNSNSSGRSHSNSNPDSTAFPSQGRQHGSPQSSSREIYPVMSEGGSRNPRGQKTNVNGKRGRDATGGDTTDDRGLRVLSPMSQPNVNGEPDAYEDEDLDAIEGADEEVEEADRDAFVDAPDSQMADDDARASSHSDHGAEQGQPPPQQPQNKQQQQQNPVSAIIEPIAKYIQKQTRPRQNDSESNARWQKRMENAMAKMNAELAALRELNEMQRGRSSSVYSSIVHPFSSSRPAKASKQRILSWMLESFLGLTSSLVKHLIIDAMLLALITLWMHFRGIPPERLEESILGWIRRIQAWTVFKKLNRIRKGEDRLPVPSSLKRLAHLGPKS